MRGWMNQTSAAMALFGGAPGFFTPRLMAPWFVPAGGAGATSYYETAKLRSTLERLVDFDRINSGSVRFTVGAVNVRSGNLVCYAMQRLETANRQSLSVQYRETKNPQRDQYYRCVRLLRLPRDPLRKCGGLVLEKRININRLREPY